MAIKKQLNPQAEVPASNAAKAAYPFPIEILIGEGVPAIGGACLKLTETGFLMRVATEYHFKVGGNHQVRFQLPGRSVFINEAVKVIKTYDALGVESSNKLKVSYIVEMHFRSLAKEKREQLLNFMKAIGQT